MMVPALLTLWLIAPEAGMLPEQDSRRGITVPESSRPDFALPDVFTGTVRHLSEFTAAHRSVVLFFFCGCSACRALSLEWARLQASKSMEPDTATLIVSSAGAEETRAQVQATGMDRKRTAVFCDTADLAVTLSLYHAERCPRFLVRDRQGRDIATNLGAVEDPQAVPAYLFVARIRAALILAAKKRAGSPPK